MELIASENIISTVDWSQKREKIRGFTGFMGFCHLAGVENPKIVTGRPDRSMSRRRDILMSENDVNAAE